MPKRMTLMTVVVGVKDGDKVVQKTIAPGTVHNYTDDELAELKALGEQQGREFVRPVVNEDKELERAAAAAEAKPTAAAPASAPRRNSAADL